MTVLYLILLVLAAGCFAMASFGRARVEQSVALVPLGLFFWVLVPLIHSIVALGD